jgi:hypothetical protein
MSKLRIERFLSALILGILIAGAILPATPRAFQVLVFAAMSYALWQTGARLCLWLVPDWEPLNRAVAAFALAVGIAIVPATWMGHFGVLRPALFLAWTAAVYLSSRFLPAGPAVPEERERPVQPARLARGEHALLLGAALAITLVGLGEIHAWRYEPPLDFDDLSYHLSTVATWIRHGDLRMIRFSMGDPSTPFYPLASEMTSWILIAPFRDSDVAARWTELLFAVFSFLATAAVARRLGLPLRGAAFAALVYAGIHEIFPVRAMTAGNDHTLSFFTLAALDASLAFARRPRARTAVVAGSALGLVLATKYVGVLFAPVLLAVLLLLRFAERRRSDEMTPSASQRWLPAMGVLLACAFVAAGYTYLRNWVTAGNPIFPAPVRILGAQIFPGWGGILTSERASLPESQIVVWRFLTRSPDFFGFYFPFTLLPAAVLAPLAALARRRWRHLLVFLLPTVFFLEFLYLMPVHQGNRYFLPGIALAAVAFAWLVSRPNPQAFLLRATMLLWISWQTIWQCEWATPEKIVTLVAALAGGALLELLWLLWRKRRARAPAAASGPRLELWKPIAVAVVLAVAALTLGKVVATYQDVKLEHRPGALALERLAGPRGSRIAYTGLNAPYLFFGSHLQNQVEIVPRTPDLESRTYRWGGPLATPYAVKRYQRWRTNLERLGIDFVVVQRTPWEDPERRWMVRRPDEFRLEYADPDTEIWRVLPAGSALPIPEKILVGQGDLLLPAGLLVGEPVLGLLGGDLAADHGELLLQVLGLALPVVRSAEVRPGGGEGGVVPAAGDPGGVMDDPHPPQRLDQRQRRAVEVAELDVSFEEALAQGLGVGVAAGEGQPEVLHGRPQHHVVEVEHPQQAVPEEDVPQVEVAVDAVDGNPGHPAFGDRGDGEGGVEVAVPQVVGEHVVRFQPVQVLADVGVGGEPQPVLGLAAGAHVVHPPHQHAQPPGPGLVELVGGAPSAAVGEAVEDVVDAPQRAAPRERPHGAHRDLLPGEVLEEQVLLQNLLLAPAPRAVELGDHPGAVGQLHLVDPVLERVEGIADGVALEAPGFDGGQHLLGGQGEEEVGFGRGVVRHAANVAKIGVPGRLALITPALFSRPPLRPDGRRGRKTSLSAVEPLSPTPGGWRAGREGLGSEGSGFGHHQREPEVEVGDLVPRHAVRGEIGVAEDRRVVGGHPAVEADDGR